MSTWLGITELSTDRITLRPITFDDTEALATLVDDPEPYRWTSGVPTDIESARNWIDKALADPEHRVAYVVVDNQTGRILGSTSFYEIDPGNLSTAIGYTYYATDVQGTTVNPTAKYLLLRHAFEDCGAVRVVWHTHESNARSRAAIAKLGATFEGLLRKHRRHPAAVTGWRTTAQYAMTDDDWPAARATLLARIDG
ncbi:MAG: GNAT family protein [Gordonia amarae]